jgi:hypothetical protein
MTVALRLKGPSTLPFGVFFAAFRLKAAAKRLFD